MQIKPIPLLIVGTLATALIGAHQQATIEEAEKTIQAGKALLANDVKPVTADLPAEEEKYSVEMNVSWHPWHPEGKAAGVIPVAMLDTAKEYEISPVYAAAVFIHETGWGSSSAWLEKNNPAGIKCGEKYCSYETEAEGIERMLEIMANYYENGRQTVADQRSMWSETDDAQAIAELMNQIGEKQK